MHQTHKGKTKIYENGNQKIFEGGGRFGAAESLCGLRGKAESGGRTYMSGMSGGHASDEVLGEGAQSDGGQVQREGTAVG